MMGMSLHNGYKLSAIDTDTIEEYSNTYIEMLLNGNLDGYIPENNIQQLLFEFYSTAKDNTDYENYTISEIKYMPVILFAYVNNLVKLKTITNKKYDLKRDLYGDICRDYIFDKSMDDVLGLLMNMNASELFQNFNNYIKFMFTRQKTVFRINSRICKYI